MRAVIIESKENCAIRDIPEPEPNSAEVRVAVHYVGICGSDLHYYFDGANGAFQLKEGLIPGHELSGVIDYDPTGWFQPGTPVTVHPARVGEPVRGIEKRPNLWPGGSYLGSAATWPHTQGAMAQKIVIPRENIIVLPPNLSTQRAALAEPLGVAMHAMNFAGNMRGQRVVITGAGAIGQLLMIVARSYGAEEVTVTDIHDGALTRAKELGADKVVNVTEDVLPSEAFDIAFECTGVPAVLESTFVALRRGGTQVQVGMIPDQPAGISLASIVAKEINLVGAFRFNHEIKDAVFELERQPRYEQVVTHVFPVGKVVDGFETAHNSQESGKVLIDFTDDK